jgi:multicomponent Na+:H+ antiporter subunit D
VLFAVPALSLAGIPPLSGFFAKLILLQAGLQAEEYAVAAAALAVSLLTLFSMSKIWNEAFWKPAPEDGETRIPARRAALAGPMAALATLTVLIGLAAEPMVGISMTAARQLMDPSEYIRAVMGGGE